MKLFIGSLSSNVNIRYEKSFKELMYELAKENDLVFDVSNGELLKLAYNVFKNMGRNVIGVTTNGFDYGNDVKFDRLYVENSIGTRTKKCIELADAVIILPGGIDTLDNLITAVEMKRRQKSDIPIIIYNPNHYYNKLINMIDDLCADGTISRNVFDDILISNNINEIVGYIDVYYEMKDILKRKRELEKKQNVIQYMRLCILQIGSIQLNAFTDSDSLSIYIDICAEMEKLLRDNYVKEYIDLIRVIDNKKGDMRHGKVYGIRQKKN